MIEDINVEAICTMSMPTHYTGSVRCGHDHPSEAEATACIERLLAGVTLAAAPAPLDVRQFAEELIAQIGGMMVMQRETKSATESMRGAYSDVLAIISDRLAATPAPLDK